MKSIAFLLLTAAACACAVHEAEVEGGHVHGKDDGAGTPDPLAVHGMALVGRETLFASHLPMFHRPHDYQAIFEVAAPADAARIYRDDAAETDSALYTVVPDRFRLTDAPATPRFPFPAEIDRGHFERGGQAIVARARFEVVRTVHFRKLVADAPRPASLEYILFGRGQERFLAHRITTRPDFDQLLAVRVEGVDDESLEAGPVLTFEGRPPTEPLREGETVTATLEGAPLTIEVEREHYLETGDLSF